jgi:L-amino acid N-acyltransferase YncA
MNELLIRDATPADAPALLEIYRPHVEQAVASFETVAPTADEFAARIARVQAGWAWLVAEAGGQVLGYVYGAAHAERAAYRWSVNVTAYVRADAHRRGVARQLYAALFPRLADQGYCMAFAGITLPNDASVGLHRHLGFEPCGLFRAVGHKFGAWHDVAWLQRPLRTGFEAGPPGDITP